MVSALVEDPVQNLHSFSKCGQNRWIAFAQDPCDTQSKSFRTHLDLSH